MTYLLLWGNGFSQILRNGRGEVLGPYPLLPDKMQVIRNEDGELIYLYQNNLNRMTFHKDVIYPYQLLALTDLQDEIWQYTSDGKVNGYTGRLDCNYAYKNYPKIMRENGLNGLIKTATSSSPQKSVEELAKEVIAGKWGNGNEHREKLQTNGYDYDAVQDR